MNNKVNRFWTGTLILLTAIFSAVQTNSFSNLWKEDLINQKRNLEAREIYKIEKSDVSEYFKYHSVIMLGNIFHDYEKIPLKSDREIYKPLPSMNFSHKIWKDMDEDWLFEKSTFSYDYNKEEFTSDKPLYSYTDGNNPKKIEPRRYIYWELPVTCHDLGDGVYMLESSISVSESYGITKTQIPPFYNYFRCENTQTTPLENFPKT